MLNLLPSFDTLQAFVLLILGFGFVIFVHELGHFLACKAVGIKVQQFALGFGTAALAWRKGIGLRLMHSTESEMRRRAVEYLADRETKQVQAGDAKAANREYNSVELGDAATALGLGETEYRLNWFPLGGYVKMLGQEDMDPNARSDDPRAFNRKPIWARTIVISAGVTMNLIFAMIFFIIAFMAGLELPPAISGGVVPGSVAALAYARGHEGQKEFQGLKPQDVVKEIDHKPTLDFTDLMVAGALGRPDETVTLLIDRPGVGALEYILLPRKDKESGLLGFGIEPPVTTTLNEPAKWKKMKANWPQELEGWPKELKDAGVAPGMTLTAVNAQHVEYFSQLDDAIDQARGRAVKATFTDKETGKTASIELKGEPLGYLSDEGKISQLLGLVPAVRARSIGSPPELAPEKTAAFAAGMKAGDIVADINGTHFPTIFTDTGTPSIRQILRAAGTEPIRVTVLRDGQMVALKPVTSRTGQLGFGISLSEPVIARVLPSAPPAIRERNIPSGSRLVAINGQPVSTMADVQRLLQEAVDGPSASAVAGPATLPVASAAALLDESAAGAAPPARAAGQPIDLEFALLLPGDHHIHVTVPQTPEITTQIASAAWALPPSILYREMFTPLRREVSARTPMAAASIGLKKTQQFMLQTYVTLLRLTQRTVPLDQLHGPLGIATVGTQVARDGGWTYLLYFLGIISVNLVVINFLPIPVVDGGHILFLAIEKVRGSPVPVKIQAAATYGGLALILCMFLMVTYFDIARWF